MKLSATVILAAALCAAPAHARARWKHAGRETAPRAVTWKLDNLKKVGGVKVTVIGSPRVTKAPKGRALLFDGAHDGLPASLGLPRVWLEIDEHGYVDCGYCDRRFILIGGPADGADQGTLPDISEGASN